MYSFIKMRSPNNMMDFLLISSMVLVMVVFAKYVGI